MICGGILTFLCIVINAVYINTVAYSIFDLGNAEKWVTGEGGAARNFTC